MPTDQQDPPSRRRPAAFALRDLALAAAAVTVLAGATWATARLPHPAPPRPLAGAVLPAPPAAPAPVVAATAPAAPAAAAVVSPATAPVPAPALAPAPAPVVAMLPLALPVSRDPLVLAPGTMLGPTVAAALPSHDLPPVRVVARPPRPLAALSAAASARLSAAERKAAREAKARADSIARVAPLEHVLRRYSSNRTLTRRIAAAIARESRRSRVEPSLVVAVLIAENNILKPHARNRHTNASGLMQVMPGWAGRLGCQSTELTDVDVNICHGVRVLALHLREARGDLHRGLQKFNGCRPTPDSTRCDVYPSRVLAHAERLEGQMETYAKRQKTTKGTDGGTRGR